MIRFLTFTILALATQIMAIIMWGEYVWLFKLANGGVGGSPLGQIQPVLWIIIVIEIILFAFFAAVLNRKNE